MSRADLLKEHWGILSVIQCISTGSSSERMKNISTPSSQVDVKNAALLFGRCDATVA